MIVTQDPFHVFLACRFPLSPLAAFCTDMGASLGLRVVAATQPEAKTVIDKVKEEIHQSDAVLFLLENDECGESRVSDWMKTEYGIAQAMAKPIGVITQSEKLMPKNFSRDREWLDIGECEDRELAVRVAAYLHSVRQRLEEAEAARANPVQPPFIRESLSHRTRVSSAGKIEYQTHVRLRCLVDGLSDVRHSIHMNYALCWPARPIDEVPTIDLIDLDPHHTFTQQLIAHTLDRYTFKLQIEPPLRRGETTNYGWRSEFAHYLPITAEELRPRLDDPQYPFPDGRVLHHYFVNHPTNELTMRLDFENGSLIGDCNALAFVGRAFSMRSVDRHECERIAGSLKVETFLGSKQVTLSVSHPRFGYTYAIGWHLNE